MSVRAAQAYDEGEKPLSKWRKADILSAVSMPLSRIQLTYTRSLTLSIKVMSNKMN